LLNFCCSFRKTQESARAGKQHDALKERTMDKTLESTLKASINTTLPTCDDKGVFTDDDDDTYRKRK
jgi:hypothetical protein